MVTLTTRSATQGSTTSTSSKNGSLRASTRSRKPIRTAPRLDLNNLKMDYDPMLEVRKRDRPMGLQDAPTYWPNEKEWADPLGYIQSIAEEGTKYGIIKIIPPEGWKPQFSVDTERFFFRTRKQELNSMEGATRSTISYLDKLAKFHRQQGTNLTKLPSLDKQPIDLYALKRSVDVRGGFKIICQDKKWAEVGRELGYGGIKNVTSVSTCLKNAYQKYLLPYELYLEKAKPEFLREMGLTPSPQQERKREGGNMSPEVVRNLMDQFKGGDRGDTIKEEMEEDVKTESIADTNDMRDGTPTPSQKGLKRSFEESTVRSSSISTENEKEAEPARRESKRLKKGKLCEDDKLMKEVPVPTVVGSNMAQHAHTVKASRMGGVVLPSPSKKPGENCEICGRGDNALSMLLCDGCDTGYHTFCLDPPLKAIPKYDWYCTECLVGTNEFGFEDGEEYSLAEFQEKADSFRKEYIKSKLRPNSEDLNVTENEVEAEFWRMVSNVQETVEVDYGADIHSTTHGSGFPTIETHPTDPYSTDPWNLNVMPLDNQSLFRHIKSDVSGMTVPWLYVGMMFSTFCWHNEDHYCYSINYQHFGATKTWYGIPGSDAEKFEAAMRNAVPDLFETQPDLLFQLVTMLSPGRLVEEGVKVYAVDQRPNQFVITFPQAYHAGFNHGFNFNEAVNFAPSDWEVYGRACVERYSEYKKMPVFSHDELLITAALHDSSIKTAKWLTSAIDTMVVRELRSRDKIRELFPGIEEQVIDEDLPSDEYYQCSVCKTYIYLSQITCDCTTNAVCSSHASELCDCDISTRILRLRYTDQDLDDLVLKISERAKIPEHWTQKYHAVLNEFERPPLRTLRSLLAEAERIPYPLPDLPALKAFVERANEWVDEANSFVARKHQNRRKNERVWRAGSRVQELEERDRNQRSRDYVYKLLDQADELGFDAVEIDLLREKAEAIEEFQERAKKALDGGSVGSLEEYSELIDEGKSLNVDLPALDTLERIVDQLKWVEKATELTDLYLTLDEVLEVMAEGERCGISLDHELMKQLAYRRDKGRYWEERARNLLDMESVPFEALDNLLNEATDLSVNKESYDRLESIIDRIREANQQITNLMVKVTSNGIASQPPLAEARKLAKIIDQLPVKPTDVLTFKKMVIRSEEWVKRGKRLFGKNNASVNQLEDHLTFVLARNEHVFDSTDVPKGEEGGSPCAAETKDSDDGPYCICRSNPTGEMVECDKCKEWYHMKCLKINKKKFDQNEGWDCPICDWKKEIPRSSTRPTLSQLKEWVDLAAPLPFLPEELRTVNQIIAGADAWVASIQPLLQAGQIRSISKCRFYLRKIEGAEVFLPNEYNFFRQAAHQLAPLTSTPPPVIEESKSLKKTKPRKPKLESIGHQAPHPHQQQAPRFSIRPSYDPHHQEQQRILPAQGPPRQLPLEHPQQAPPQAYQSQPRFLSYDPASVPILNSQPPKGMFAPPPQQGFPSQNPTKENRRLSDHLGERPAPTCGCCHRDFISGAHNEPKNCSQCHRLYHLQCIGKYGGRIYPSMSRLHETASQCVPNVTNPSSQASSAAGMESSAGASLHYATPQTSIPSHRTVIDLTDSRSPSPDARPPTGTNPGPGPSNLRIPYSVSGASKSPTATTQNGSRNHSVDVGGLSVAQTPEKRNMSTPPSTDGQSSTSKPVVSAPKPIPTNPSTPSATPVEKDNRQDHSIKRILVDNMVKL